MFIEDTKVYNGLLFICKTDCQFKKLNFCEKTINEEKGIKQPFLFCENAEICKNAIISKKEYDEGNK